MEGLSGCNDPLELISSILGGGSTATNDLSYASEVDANQHFTTTMESDRNGQNPSHGFSFSHQFEYPKLTQNFFEFMDEKSPFLGNSSTQYHESARNGIGVQRDLLCNNNLGVVGGCESANFLSYNMGCPKQLEEGEASNNSRSSQYYTCSQSQGIHSTWAHKPTQDDTTFSQVNPRVAVSSSIFLMETQTDRSRQKAASAEHRRRTKIDDKLKALQELIPHSGEGNKVALMGEIIHHIRNLQLQIKELSRSRLVDGDSATVPLVLLQMMNPSIEDMMEELLESNPAAAVNLLESKGLFMLPMALANQLQEPI